MKAGWKTVKLREILQVQNGYAFDSEYFGSEGMPLIRIRDIKQGVSTDTFYSGEYDDAYIVKKGDYLIGMDGEFRCYMWRGPDALLNQRVCRLTNFGEHVLPAFICYGINKYLKEIEDATGYSTVKHLSSKSVLSIEFPLPPLAEQKRIVALLDKAFAGIEHVEHRINEELRYVDELRLSRLREIFFKKQEWTECTLGDVCHVYQPKTLGQKELVTGPYKVYGANGVIGDHNEYNHEVPELTLGCRGSCGSVHITEPKSWINGNAMVVRPNKAKVTRDFLALALKGGVNLGLAISGTAQPQITRKSLSPIPFGYPSLEEQVRITKSSESADSLFSELKSLLTLKRSYITELRSAVLGRAFAGELPN